MSTWLIVALLIVCPNPLWLGLLWIYYAALMNIKRVRDLLEAQGKDFHWIAKLFGYTGLAIGLLLDLRCNVIECWVIFRERPKETLVTSRLKRYVHGPDGWRKGRAIWFEDVFQLNKLDPSGNHLD